MCFNRMLAPQTIIKIKNKERSLVQTQGGFYGIKKKVKQRR